MTSPPSRSRSPRRPRTGLRAALGSVAAGGLLLTGLTTVTPPTAGADDRPLPAGRKLTSYVVKPGDTATGLAVRFHAWTAELISHNHLGPSATLRVGERIAIPVVRSAVRKDRQHRKAHRAKRRAVHEKPHRKAHRKHATPRRHHGNPSRATVRRTIVATARRHGVDPQLALAVSWQEAGWQMHHVSHAHAIGAMQVLPTTGTWMSLYAGRPLKLRNTRDNVLAGVLLLDVLDDLTRSTRHQVAAYYQGLGAVREHGLYDDTKRYVRNVRAIQHRLERGLPPA
ncbi:LysM peptidoglycan-binding domain-containing protein [Nocardioides guangzhouensis]|uniref:LysM peptidoglycan-binding domain-containing protein n=1 Tax=Nocardioides guangzhouensis TaxID=2497878 RepID=A0A4Q4ZCK3_9ACTN|nr:transglycosylase SLT domain-containing protein [Nocardioides guangzhouensis]RYP85702.1 LysM peptidoglycan-binding domain-containing protein [Nocardioides guangzhouensis]